MNFEALLVLSEVTKDEFLNGTPLFFRICDGDFSTIVTVVYSDNRILLESSNYHSVNTHRKQLVGLSSGELNETTEFADVISTDFVGLFDSLSEIRHKHILTKLLPGGINNILWDLKANAILDQKIAQFV
jgi:hypothetical protein